MCGNLAGEPLRGGSRGGLALQAGHRSAPAAADRTHGRCVDGELTLLSVIRICLSQALRLVWGAQDRTVSDAWQNYCTLRIAPPSAAYSLQVHFGMSMAQQESGRGRHGIQHSRSLRPDCILAGCGGRDIILRHEWRQCPPAARAPFACHHLRTSQRWQARSHERLSLEAQPSLAGA